MNLAPDLMQQFFDNNGDPLAGGKIYTYQAGTTTPQATYTDQGGGTANANPVVLDANGRANQMWLDANLSYKFVFTDSNDVTIRTVDNVIGLTTVDSVATASIQDDAVTTAKIADDAITSAKLRDSVSVDGDRAVTTNHIRNNAITRAKIASGAVADLNVSAKTADYTMTDDDDFITCDASSAAFTVTLPAAAGVTGRVFHIMKIDSSLANAITIDGNGSETINGATTTTLNTQYEAVKIISDGSNWYILERRIPAAATSYTATLGAVTTAPTKGTVSRDTARWRRRGSFCEIYYDFAQSSAGSAGSGSYLVSMPSGIAIDTSFHRADEGNLEATDVIGQGSFNSGASWSRANFELRISPYNANNLIMYCQDSGTTVSAIGSGFGALSSTKVAYNFNARVKVTGWND